MDVVIIVNGTNGVLFVDEDYLLFTVRSQQESSTISSKRREMQCKLGGTSIYHPPQQFQSWSVQAARVVPTSPLFLASQTLQRNSTLRASAGRVSFASLANKTWLNLGLLARSSAMS